MDRHVGNIPNLLSAIRLLLAVVFPFSAPKAWAVLILTAAASDFLDGWIARRWNLASWQGGLLDAVADKLFVLSVLITYLLAGRLSLWWIPLVIARDLTVSLIALYAFLRRAWPAFQEMEASLSGKIATGGQFLLFLAVALVPSAIVALILPFSVFLSLHAALDYGRKFVRALRQPPPGLGTPQENSFGDASCQ